MVVPLALFAHDGDHEILVQRGNGNVETMHRIRKTVGIENLVQRRLDERRALLLSILQRAGVGVLEAIGIDRDKVCTYCWNGKE